MERTTTDNHRSAIERAQEQAQESLEQLLVDLDQGHSESLLGVLRALGNFHEYSFANAMMIVGQRPDATRVAGYRTWQRLGRQVRRGEKGIVIIAPMVGRRDEEGGDERVVRGFRAARVFDIEQTDGEPLPELEVTRGDPGEHAARIREYAQLHGIDVEYSDGLGLANGASTGGKILLRRGLEPADEFATLVHEIAHEMLHQGMSRTQRPPLAVRETEAEAVSFAVSNAIGLEVGGAARDYIQMYRGDAAVLKAALDRVHRVSTSILAFLKSDEADAAIAEAA
ncbi:MAG: ArdC-like ssDNA-binding domain-containing protein [Planctomycetota bacterium]